MTRLPGPGLEDQFFERVQSRAVEGAAIRLASPEDLNVPQCDAVSL